ncbi:MAG: ribbon-helix-helix domain-containing protein [Lactobacillales bacterium]|jgi:predicted DNA-binding ribbon-helix-helix protein|nr:ribbon-helix-helix domain-containing protein [Lactobacillales bacterium]
MQKHSLVILGHTTSITLESEFWEELGRIAGARGMSKTKLIAHIDAMRTGNLSSALRVFILKELQNAARGQNNQNDAQ